MQKIKCVVVGDNNVGKVKEKKRMFSSTMPYTVYTYSIYIYIYSI